jgi:hypothetical protein
MATYKFKGVVIAVNGNFAGGGGTPVTALRPIDTVT